MTTAAPSASDPTDDPQREKLRLEIQHLRRPMWKSPAIVVAFIALTGSVLGNIVQFVNGSISARQSEERLIMEKNKWMDERQKLQDEMSRLARLDKEEQQRRETLQQELSYVNEQIQIWDGAIFKSEASLIVFQNMPDDVASYRVLLTTQRAQRAALVERKDRVERLLSSCN